VVVVLMEALHEYDHLKQMGKGQKEVPKPIDEVRI